jgi:outer membrane lipoprotein SlyB
MQRRYDNKALGGRRRRRRRPEDKYALIGALLFAIAGGLLGSLGPVGTIIGGVFAGAIVGAVAGDIIGKWLHSRNPPPENPA